MRRGVLFRSRAGEGARPIVRSDRRRAKSKALIRASLELNRGRASGAIEALKRSSDHDMGAVSPLFVVSLYPAYARGGTYLAMGDGTNAAAEYQKFLQHRTVIANFPLGALAYLGLGRAYALADSIENSRTAYEQFFSLWKDADPDLPILKSAKAEYAKLATAKAASAEKGLPVDLCFLHGWNSSRTHLGDGVQFLPLAESRRSGRDRPFAGHMVYLPMEGLKKMKADQAAFMEKANP